MPFSIRQKKILKYVAVLILLAFLFGLFSTTLTLWKSVYIENGQTVEDYNSVELDILSSFEKFYKSMTPALNNNVFEKVHLYIPKKNQNELLLDLPNSRKKWTSGFLLDKGKLIKIKAKHRGDNPNNWLHDKKSWRVKKKKKDIEGGRRIFNYILPRDPNLINTYLGYYIANKMGILAPKSKFVQLYINEKYQGLYLEVEHLNENFLRNNDIMPVNIYKGTPSRTDKPLNSDSDLFNNPYLWEKKATFNPKSKDDYSDLIKLLTLTRSSVNSVEKMKHLEKIANINKWAKFSAYETIMQSWHNYEKNNMYILSDPWRGEIYPIAYDTIFNDTKSQTDIKENVFLDNAPHALTEVFINNSKFLYEKYKVISSAINNEIYSDVRNEARRIYRKVKVAWEKDPSHAQFVLSNGFDRSLMTQNGMDLELDKLIDRIDFIEIKIKNIMQANKMFWQQSEKGVQFAVESVLPITGIEMCFKAEMPILKLDSLLDNKLKFTGYKAKNNKCQRFDIVLNSNRVKVHNNQSRVTTFFASSGFEISPTVFNFKFEKGFLIENIKFKLLGNEKYKLAPNKVVANKTTGALHNTPFKKFKSFEELVWQGDVNIKTTTIINNPVKILPGTTIYLEPEVSIIFKNKVSALGRMDDGKINFVKSKESPWGVIALVGNEAGNSKLENVNISGGSGGYYDNLYFTGMVSIYNTNNIQLTDINISDNYKYDDLIHVLYSDNVNFSNCLISNAESDALDIDISSVIIDNCNFSNAGNDSIDSMTSVVKILNTSIDRSGDKGISAGERSNISVLNVKINNSEIAIQSKDDSLVKVNDSKFLNNKIQLNAYRKNWRYGAGGRIVARNSFFYGNNNVITAKGKSKINIIKSKFNQDYLHMKSKKVRFDDNIVSAGHD